MNDEALLGSLRLEAARVAAISGSDVDIEQPVAACPGWSVGRVVGHLGRVHRWASAMLQAEPPVFIDPGELEARAPRDATVFDWYRDGVAALMGELERRDLGAPAFTWDGEHDRRWWLRRLAHETAVHRFDVEHALASASPVDADAAADGIAEFFELFVPRRFDAAAFADDYAGRTMHLHCTDVEGEWLIRFADEGVAVERVHAKGDVAVRGEASDLFLVLWNRLPHDNYDVFGDTDIFDHFLDAAAF
ncbi:MAG: maleylpyruvate isomerase N-terminal domain-containing protein [Actinobacteria bacterium]|nr:maleylpyruvate isomerase N-terminal domain-containing protein [Actinomycetota bacterium]